MDKTIRLNLIEGQKSKVVGNTNSGLHFQSFCNINEHNKIHFILC